MVDDVHNHLHGRLDLFLGLRGNGECKVVGRDALGHGIAEIVQHLEVCGGTHLCLCVGNALELGYLVTDCHKRNRVNIAVLFQNNLFHCLFPF